MARQRARLATKSAAQLCFLGTTVQAHDQPAPAIFARAHSATRCAEYSRILPCSAQNLTTMMQSPLMCTRLPNPPYARRRSASADRPHASAQVGDILLPMLTAASAIRSHRLCSLLAHSTAPAPAVCPLALPSMAKWRAAVGEVNLARVAGFSAELVALLDRPGSDEGRSLLSAPPACLNPPLDVSPPRMDNPRGRPPMLPRGHPRGGRARARLRRVATDCASSIAPVAAATVCPGAVGGPPSLSGAPGRALVGLPAPARPPHSQHLHPPTSSHTYAYANSLSRAGSSGPTPPSSLSSDESGAQTARTNQSAPSLHPTADLLWIEDAMKEA